METQAHNILSKYFDYIRIFNRKKTFKIWRHKKEKYKEALKKKIILFILLKFFIHFLFWHYFHVGWCLLNKYTIIYFFILQKFIKKLFITVEKVLSINKNEVFWNHSVVYVFSISLVPFIFHHLVRSTKNIYHFSLSLSLSLSIYIYILQCVRSVRRKINVWVEINWFEFKVCPTICPYL